MDEGAELRQQISEAQQKLQEWDDAHADIMAERKALRDEVARLHRLAQPPPPQPVAPPPPPPDPRLLPPVITDHALLRYLERRFSFDSEKMRSQLCSNALRTAVKVGAQSVKTEGGRLILVGNRVVTFVTKPGHKVRKSA